MISIRIISSMIEPRSDWNKKIVIKEIFLFQSNIISGSPKFQKCVEHTSITIWGSNASPNAQQESFNFYISEFVFSDVMKFEVFKTIGNLKPFQKLGILPEIELRGPTKWKIAFRCICLKYYVNAKHHFRSWWFDHPKCVLRWPANTILEPITSERNTFRIFSIALWKNLTKPIKMTTCLTKFV